MSPRVTYVVARVLIACAFLGIGLEPLLGAAGILPDRGTPTKAWLFFYGFQALAGLVLMLGWQATRITIVMAVLMAVDAFSVHPFWSYRGAEQHEHLMHFLKDLSVIGGLVLVSWVAEQEGAGSRE